MSKLWLDQLSETLTNSGILVYTWYADRDEFVWSGDLYSFLGLESGDIPVNSMQFHKLLNPQQVPERLSALHEALDKDLSGDVSASFTVQYKVRDIHENQIDVEETATVQLDKVTGSKIVSGFLKRKQQSEALKAPEGRPDTLIPAAFDGGYAIYGRKALLRKLEEWFDTHDRHHATSGYFLAVGIDRMAIYNDVMGPRYADEIIEKTGARLHKIIAGNGESVRIDGDVFGLFFKEAPHNEMAAVAKYILNNFYSMPLETSQGPIGIGVSIGGVVLTQAKDPHAIITMAEMAMNVAKDKGRSCFVAYDEAAQKLENNRFLLQSADNFMRALKDDRLRLAFQPIIGAKDNSVSFHECLMRLVGEDGKLLSAGAFVPAIEELGLSRFVDQYAIRKAIDELNMFPDLVLSVNVSPMTLMASDWLRSLVAALRDRPSVAKRLIVEITESTVLENKDQINRIVSTIKDLGCRVALDDFGAGYTAFCQLKDLNVDIVKIDKSFVRNMESAEHNQLFIRALKMLAEGSAIETVGEGAETLAEAKLLADDGIDHIQGYVYGFPRVERLWLPKDHLHRRIPLGGKDGLEEILEEDYALLAQYS
ncbi:MAG: bifunctional diguanylate cyclase/phosphodiesterase [Rhodospirillales bacterium]|nr:bifunctional diguanylate cyclase/phosphodiesterase [Rhodospirillales bacterium]MCB9995465.1 bifunctional diguanylate cyclase/phosphodiesterase [Rhodospirillales bacterium]